MSHDLFQRVSTTTVHPLRVSLATISTAGHEPLNHRGTPFAIQAVRPLLSWAPLFIGPLNHAPITFVNRNELKQANNLDFTAGQIRVVLFVEVNSVHIGCVVNLNCD